MAVRVRRGLKADFDPNKLVAGEPAAPLDTRELYIAFAPGDVQKLATHENVREMVDEVTEEVVADLTEGVNNATDYANTQGDYAKDQGTYAKNQGDYAKDQGDYAKNQGQAAEAVVLGDVATDTIAGIVKGGGNIEIGQDGEMNYNMTGDTKDNTTTFTEATTDEDIASGENHATLFGKILKSIKTLRYNIGVLTTEKIDKSAIVNQDAINDVNKVPSSAVTYAHGQAITQLNNNLINIPYTGVTVNAEFVASGTVGYIVRNSICFVIINVNISSNTNNDMVASGLPVALAAGATKVLGWTNPSAASGFFIDAGNTEIIAFGDIGLFYTVFSYPV